MHLGVCTTDFARSSADALFAKAKRLGFECVQLAADSVSEWDFTANGQCEIPAVTPREAIRAVKAASDRYGLPVAAMNGTFNMAHPDRAVRRESLARFPAFLDAAAELGCPIVSLCSGTRQPRDLWTYHADNGTETAYEDMAEGMRFCAAEAEKRNITLAIETEASNVVSSARIAHRVLEDVGSPRLKMILDCANLFARGTAVRENARSSLDDAFYWFGPHIVLAHGKDIRPGRDISFCAAGQGMVDFPHALHLLKQYGFSGDMMLHGVYEDALFPAATAYMRSLMQDNG